MINFIDVWVSRNELVLSASETKHYNVFEKGTWENKLYKTTGEVNMSWELEAEDSAQYFGIWIKP